MDLRKPLLLTALICALFLWLGTSTVKAQTVTGISLSPSTVVSGNSSLGTVTISGAAPQSGFVVNLTSSLPSYASVPDTVTVAPGATYADFTVNTIAHSRTLDFILKASSKQATLVSLGDGIASLAIQPSTVVGGSSSLGTVTLLSPAPTGGWRVNLSSSLPSYASVPSSLVIPEGASQGTFNISTVAHTRQLGFLISASDATTRQTANLTTTPPNLLTGSPWPKFHGNLQNTGLGSGVAGSGQTVWKFHTGASVESSPAIGADGTIYVGSDDHNLYAITPQGNLKWKYYTGAAVESSPAIASDGTIYVGSGASLFAINANGTRKWVYAVGALIQTAIPTIGLDGAIYIGSIAGFYAINPDGTLRWSYPSDLYGNTVHVLYAPVVMPDGNICVSTGYYNGTDMVYCFGPQGDVKWKTLVPGPSSVAVGQDGTIYVGCSGQIPRSLYALEPATGTLKWKSTVDGAVEACPAVGPDGTIYVAASSGVYAFSSQGALLWSNLTAGNYGSSPLIGSDGSIYVGLSTVNFGSSGLYAFSSSGEMMWVYPTKSYVTSSPAMGSDGTLYFGSDDGYLYAVR